MKVQPILLASILTAVMTIPTTASADDWTLRGWAAWVSPTGSPDFATDVGDVDVDFGGSLGLGLDLERSIGERSGLALGISTSAPSIDVRFTASAPGVASFTASDDLRSTTVSAGWYFHLTPQRRVDLFVGPEVAWTSFGDLAFDTGSAAGSTSVGDDLGLGARLGLDAPVGESDWSIHAALRWLDLEADLDDVEPESDSSLDLSPWAVHIGLSRSF